MEHVPVLLEETISWLNVRPDGIYVDGTLGRAGHASELARRLVTGRLICIDRDEAAIEEAGDRLRAFEDRVTLVKAGFDSIGEILDQLGIDAVDGMMFDLGVSSPQLDDPERGFSYMRDSPIDMRMDLSSRLTAEEIVNTWSRERLREILFEYGEERYAGSIAAAIVRYREKKPVKTTLELAEIIKSAMPGKALREKQHPAKRSFMALRIAANDELGALDRLLKAVPTRLRVSGRICVITFHSLEDRAVKRAFEQKDGCVCPKELPYCVCGFTRTLRPATRKPIEPGEDEIRKNPRARSAKLRVAERI